MPTKKIGVAVFGFLLVSLTAFAEQGFIYTRTPLQKLPASERKQVVKLTAKVMQNLIREKFSGVPLIEQVTPAINAKTLEQFDQLGPEVHHEIRDIAKYIGAEHLYEDYESANLTPSSYMIMVGGS